MTTCHSNFWATFLTSEQIVKTFLAAGGNLGNVKKGSMDAIVVATRLVFQYLMPGHVRSSLDVARLDGIEEYVPGFVFIIGPDNASMYQIPDGLLERCCDMFLTDHKAFVCQRDPQRRGGQVYEWWQEGKIRGLVQNLEFMESDAE